MQAVEKEWGNLTGMAADESQKQKIAEARKKDETVHFASSMDVCHLKNSELEPQFQKYKGRVVLRGDIAKDHSGLYAVFTEHVSSASQSILYQDYQDAQDEQQTQYLLTPMSKWKMHHHCSKNSDVRMSR